jgi:predicted lipoprotein with Yx(FWY)xxD motif
MRSRFGWAALSALVLVAVLLAGCGGSGSTATTSASASDQGGVAVLKTMRMPDPATLVVNAEGMTVYEFRRDDPMIYQFRRSPVPTCYKACMATWMPVMTNGSPRAQGGAKPYMLGTIKRRDGGVQVTYDGHPLYIFRGDARPGEVNGEGMVTAGAKWHAVESDGDAFIVAG